MPDSKTRQTLNKERAARMAPAERRDQLVRCAVTVFARYGLGNAGHAQVADEAGVSTPTVFLYLPNRQALIDAVLTEVDRYLVEMVTTTAAQYEAGADKLLEITRAFADAIDSDRDVVKVFLNWSTVVNDETWPQYIDFQDRILRALATVITDGIRDNEIPASVNPMWGAHIVMGSAHMIAQMKFRGRSRDEIDEFLNALIHGVVSGQNPPVRA